MEGKEEEEIAVEDWETMVCASEGRNLSHTASDSAADLKVVETKESLQASRGVVKETIFAMQPSGRLLNSTLPSTIIFIAIDR